LCIKKTALRALAILLAGATLFLSSCIYEAPPAQTGASSGAVSSVPSVLPELVPDTVTPLTITEIMAKNKATLKDPYGSYSPWIELYNSSDEPLSLASYSLIFGGVLWNLPDKQLEGGGYYLVFANGKGEGDCASFTLADSGTLLLAKDGKGAEQVKYINETDHHSYIVENGGESEFPTPGYIDVKSASSLTISEIMVGNGLFPIDGRLCAYLEIYNSGKEELDLSQFFVSDSLANRYKYRLPEKKLAAGEYAVIKNIYDMILPISKKGGTLMITRADGVVSASTEYPELQNGEAYAHGIGICLYPTPGHPNTPEHTMSAICNRTGLIITEVMSSNSKLHKTDGEFYDMIELCNNSDTDILLSDYCISDSSGDLFRYNLPMKLLAPGEYFSLVCSGEGGEHASFKLSQDGETLYVTKKEDMYICDVLSVPYVPTDRSFGRTATELCYFAEPSFGKANGEGFSSLSPTPTVSLEGGFYTGPQQITISSESGDIYFTTNNSAPTMAEAHKYNGEVIEITKNTSLKFFCIDGKRIPSAVITVNYFIDPLPLTLPIIEVTVDHSQMYGSGGIYTNYSKKTEIPANAALYVDGKLEFSVDCGIKIFGAYSRRFDKKSYQLKFRSKYGPSKLEYDIFGDGEVTEFNSLVLRSGSQDYYRAMMRDEFATTVIKKYMPNVLVQNNRPCSLYINGEYIGVYYMREKINDDFVSSHFGVSPESVTVVNKMSSVERGPSGAEWKALWKYICSNDLTKDEHYAYICENISIDSVIEFYIAMAWSDNRDCGNVRVFKSTENDGKWRFIFFDSDLAFGTYRQTVSSTAKYLYGTYNEGETQFNALIYKLLRNTTFRDLFLKRLNELCTTAFTNDVVIPLISQFESTIDNDMQYLVYGPSYKSWKTKYVVWLKEYVENRDKTVVKEFVSLLKLSQAEAAAYFPSFYPAAQ